MQLRHLEVVHAVLRHGSASAAARELALSQPAVSRLLRDAEAALGLQLFERSPGQGLRATAAALRLRKALERAHRDLCRIQAMTAPAPPQERAC